MAARYPVSHVSCDECGEAMATYACVKCNMDVCDYCASANGTICGRSHRVITQEEKKRRLEQTGRKQGKIQPVKSDVTQNNVSSSSVHACQRFERVNFGWSLNGKPDAISLQTDKAVELIGVSLYGGQDKDFYLVELEVFEGSEADTNYKRCLPFASVQGVGFKSDGSPTPQAVHLSAPVKLKANTRYTCLIRMQGPVNTHFGAGGKQKVVCDSGVTFEFFKSARSSRGTDVDVGQIPGILYRKI